MQLRERREHGAAAVTQAQLGMQQVTHDMTTYSAGAQAGGSLTWCRAMAARIAELTSHIDNLVAAKRQEILVRGFSGLHGAGPSLWASAR